jgi:hypothetical protein
MSLWLVYLKEGKKNCMLALKDFLPGREQLFPAQDQLLIG